MVITEVIAILDATSKGMQEADLTVPLRREAVGVRLELARGGRGGTGQT